MSYLTLIAVDPGANGAVVYRDAAGAVLGVRKHDGDDVMLYTSAWARAANSGICGCAALIERVWASPVMGVSSSFAFGDNFGAWRLALKAAGIPVFGVTPQAWQKAVASNVTGQGDVRKTALKELATARFDVPVGEPLLPRGVRVTLANCDALLLSQYAVERNKSGQPLGEKL